MTSSQRVKVHHLCEKLGYSKILEVKEFETASLDEACASFQPVRKDEIPAILKATLDSPILALGRGLFDRGWDAIQPTEDILASIQQQGMAFWWRNGQGLLLAWDDENEDGNVLGLGLPVCALESSAGVAARCPSPGSPTGPGWRVLDRPVGARSPVRGASCRVQTACGTLRLPVRKTTSD